MFRNLALGLIASIPVVISSALNFGAMGLLGIPLSTSTALISSIAVGIGIDYSIHMTERYRVLRSEGLSGAEAGRRAMSDTGRAVFLNATVVICGFLVLLLSAFPPNRQVGALVSLNMAAAFAATMTITFLFVRKYDDRKRKGENA
jgi:predicted RND superfamily exporter protein